MTPLAGAPEQPRKLVRPYAITGGRTRVTGAAGLPLEALCFLTPTGRRAELRFERASVAHLCGEVLSVAEIAAHTQLPLGVARILVADLRDEGFLDVHLPDHSGGRLSAAVLEKVLDGLRAL